MTKSGPKIHQISFKMPNLSPQKDKLWPKCPNSALKCSNSTMNGTNWAQK
jgi:hypothetical protein